MDPINSAPLGELASPSFGESAQNGMNPSHNSTDQPDNTAWFTWENSKGSQLDQVVDETGLPLNNDNSVMESAVGSQRGSLAGGILLKNGAGDTPVGKSAGPAVQSGSKRPSVIEQAAANPVSKRLSTQSNRVSANSTTLPLNPAYNDPIISNSMNPVSQYETVSPNTPADRTIDQNGSVNQSQKLTTSQTIPIVVAQSPSEPDFDIMQTPADQVVVSHPPLATARSGAASELPPAPSGRLTKAEGSSSNDQQSPVVAVLSVEPEDVSPSSVLYVAATEQLTAQDFVDSPQLFSAGMDSLEAPTGDDHVTVAAIVEPMMAESIQAESDTESVQAESIKPIVVKTESIMVESVSPASVKVVSAKPAAETKVKAIDLPSPAPVLATPRSEVPASARPKPTPAEALGGAEKRLQEFNDKEKERINNEKAERVARRYGKHSAPRELSDKEKVFVANRQKGAAIKAPKAVPLPSNATPRPKGTFSRDQMSRNLSAPNVDLYVPPAGDYPLAAEQLYIFIKEEGRIRGPVPGLSVNDSAATAREKIWAFLGELENPLWQSLVTAFPDSQRRFHFVRPGVKGSAAGQRLALNLEEDISILETTPLAPLGTTMADFAQNYFGDALQVPVDSTVRIFTYEDGSTLEGAPVVINHPSTMSTVAEPNPFQPIDFSAPEAHPDAFRHIGFASAKTPANWPAYWRRLRSDVELSTSVAVTRRYAEKRLRRELRRLPCVEELQAVCGDADLVLSQEVLPFLPVVCLSFLLPEERPHTPVVQFVDTSVDMTRKPVALKKKTWELLRVARCLEFNPTAPGARLYPTFKPNTHEPTKYVEEVVTFKAKSVPKLTKLATMQSIMRGNVRPTGPLPGGLSPSRTSLFPTDTLRQAALGSSPQVENFKARSMPDFYSDVPEEYRPARFRTTQQAQDSKEPPVPAKRGRGPVPAVPVSMDGLSAVSNGELADRRRKASIGVLSGYSVGAAQSEVAKVNAHELVNNIFSANALLRDDVSSRQTESLLQEEEQIVNAEPLSSDSECEPHVAACCSTVSLDSASFTSSDGEEEQAVGAEMKVVTRTPGMKGTSLLATSSNVVKPPSETFPFPWMLSECFRAIEGIDLLTFAGHEADNFLTYREAWNKVLELAEIIIDCDLDKFAFIVTDTYTRAEDETMRAAASKYPSIVLPAEKPLPGTRQAAIEAASKTAKEIAIQNAAETAARKAGHTAVTNLFFAAMKLIETTAFGGWTVCTPSPLLFFVEEAMREDAVLTVKALIDVHTAVYSVARAEDAAAYFPVCWRPSVLLHHACRWGAVDIIKEHLLVDTPERSVADFVRVSWIEGSEILSQGRRARWSCGTTASLADGGSPLLVLLRLLVRGPEYRCREVAEQFWAETFAQGALSFDDRLDVVQILERVKERSREAQERGGAVSEYIKNENRFLARLDSIRTELLRHTVVNVELEANGCRPSEWELEVAYGGTLEQAVLFGLKTRVAELIEQMWKTSKTVEVSKRYSGFISRLRSDFAHLVESMRGMEVAWLGARALRRMQMAQKKYGAEESEDPFDVTIPPKQVNSPPRGRKVAPHADLADDAILGEMIGDGLDATVVREWFARLEAGLFNEGGTDRVGEVRQRANMDFALKTIGELSEVLQAAAPGLAPPRSIEDRAHKRLLPHEQSLGYELASLSRLQRASEVRWRRALSARAPQRVVSRMIATGFDSENVKTIIDGANFPSVARQQILEIFATMVLAIEKLRDAADLPKNEKTASYVLLVDEQNPLFGKQPEINIMFPSLCNDPLGPGVSRSQVLNSLACLHHPNLHVGLLSHLFSSVSPKEAIFLCRQQDRSGRTLLLTILDRAQKGGFIWGPFNPLRPALLDQLYTPQQLRDSKLQALGEASEDMYAALGVPLRAGGDIVNSKLIKRLAAERPEQRPSFIPLAVLRRLSALQFSTSQGVTVVQNNTSGTTFYNREFLGLEVMDGMHSDEQLIAAGITKDTEADNDVLVDASGVPLPRALDFYPAFIRSFIELHAHAGVLFKSDRNGITALHAALLHPAGPRGVLFDCNLLEIWMAYKLNLDCLSENGQSDDIADMQFQIQKAHPKVKAAIIAGRGNKPVKDRPTLLPPVLLAACALPEKRAASVIRVLVTLGATATIRSEEGLTVWDYALIRNSKVLAELACQLSWNLSAQTSSVIRALRMRQAVRIPRVALQTLPTDLTLYSNLLSAAFQTGSEMQVAIIVENLLCAVACDNMSAFVSSINPGRVAVQGPLYSPDMASGTLKTLENHPAANVKPVNVPWEILQHFGRLVNSVLEVASLLGFSAVVKVILSTFSVEEIEIWSARPTRALHWACAAGSTTAGRMLLESGANARRALVVREAFACLAALDSNITQHPVKHSTVQRSFPLERLPFDRLAVSPELKVSHTAFTDEEMIQTASGLWWGIVPSPEPEVPERRAPRELTSAPHAYASRQFREVGAKPLMNIFDLGDSEARMVVNSFAPHAVKRMLVDRARGAHANMTLNWEMLNQLLAQTDISAASENDTPEETLIRGYLNEMSVESVATPLDIAICMAPVWSETQEAIYATASPYSNGSKHSMSSGQSFQHFTRREVTVDEFTELAAAIVACGGAQVGDPTRRLNLVRRLASKPSLEILAMDLLGLEEEEQSAVPTLGGAERVYGRRDNVTIRCIRALEDITFNAPAVSAVSISPSTTLSVATARTLFRAVDVDGAMYVAPERAHLCPTNSISRRPVVTTPQELLEAAIEFTHAEEEAFAVKAAEQMAPENIPASLIGGGDSEVSAPDTGRDAIKKPAATPADILREDARHVINSRGPIVYDVAESTVLPMDFHSGTQTNRHFALGVLCVSNAVCEPAVLSGEHGVAYASFRDYFTGETAWRLREDVSALLRDDQGFLETAAENLGAAVLSTPVPSVAASLLNWMAVLPSQPKEDEPPRNVHTVEKRSIGGGVLTLTMKARKFCSQTNFTFESDSAMPRQSNVRQRLVDIWIRMVRARFSRPLGWSIWHELSYLGDSEALTFLFGGAAPRVSRRGLCPLTVNVLDAEGHHPVTVALAKGHWATARILLGCTHVKVPMVGLMRTLLEAAPSMAVNSNTLTHEDSFTFMMRFLESVGLTEDQKTAGSISGTTNGANISPGDVELEGRLLHWLDVLTIRNQLFHESSLTKANLSRLSKVLFLDEGNLSEAMISARVFSMFNDIGPVRQALKKYTRDVVAIKGIPEEEYITWVGAEESSLRARAASLIAQAGEHIPVPEEWTEVLEAARLAINDLRVKRDAMLFDNVLHHVDARNKDKLRVFQQVRESVPHFVCDFLPQDVENGLVDGEEPQFASSLKYHLMGSDRLFKCFGVVYEVIKAFEEQESIRIRAADEEIQAIRRLADEQGLPPPDDVIDEFPRCMSEGMMNSIARAVRDIAFTCPCCDPIRRRNFLGSDEATAEASKDAVSRTPRSGNHSTDYTESDNYDDSEYDSEYTDQDGTESEYTDSQYTGTYTDSQYTGTEGTYITGTTGQTGQTGQTGTTGRTKSSGQTGSSGEYTESDYDGTESEYTDSQYTGTESEYTDSQYTGTYTDSQYTGTEGTYTTGTTGQTGQTGTTGKSGSSKRTGSSNNRAGKSNSGSTVVTDGQGHTYGPTSKGQAAGRRLLAPGQVLPNLNAHQSNKLQTVTPQNETKLEKFGVDRFGNPITVPAGVLPPVRMPRRGLSLKERSQVEDLETLPGVIISLACRGLPKLLTAFISVECILSSLALVGDKMRNADARLTNHVDMFNKPDNVVDLDVVLKDALARAARLTDPMHPYDSQDFIKALSQSLRDAVPALRPEKGMRRLFAFRRTLSHSVVRFAGRSTVYYSLRERIPTKEDALGGKRSVMNNRCHDNLSTLCLVASSPLLMIATIGVLVDVTSAPLDGHRASLTWGVSRCVRILMANKYTRSVALSNSEAPPEERANFVDVCAKVFASAGHWSALKGLFSVRTPSASTAQDVAARLASAGEWKLLGQLINDVGAKKVIGDNGIMLLETAVRHGQLESAYLLAPFCTSPPELRGRPTLRPKGAAAAAANKKGGAVIPVGTSVTPATIRRAVTNMRGVNPIDWLPHCRITSEPALDYATNFVEVDVDEFDSIMSTAVKATIVRVHTLRSLCMDLATVWNLRHAADIRVGKYDPVSSSSARPQPIRLHDDAQTVTHLSFGNPDDDHEIVAVNEGIPLAAAQTMSSRDQIRSTAPREKKSLATAGNRRAGNNNPSQQPLVEASKPKTILDFFDESRLANEETYVTRAGAYALVPTLFSVLARSGHFVGLQLMCRIASEFQTMRVMAEETIAQWPFLLGDVVRGVSYSMFFRNIDIDTPLLSNGIPDTMGASRRLNLNVNTALGQTQSRSQRDISYTFSGKFDDMQQAGRVSRRSNASLFRAMAGPRDEYESVSQVAMKLFVKGLLAFSRGPAAIAPPLAAAISTPRSPFGRAMLSDCLNELILSTQNVFPSFEDVLTLDPAAMPLCYHATTPLLTTLPTSSKWADQLNVVGNQRTLQGVVPFQTLLYTVSVTVQAEPIAFAGASVFRVMGPQFKASRRPEAPVFAAAMLADARVLEQVFGWLTKGCPVAFPEPAPPTAGEADLALQDLRNGTPSRSRRRVENSDDSEAFHRKLRTDKPTIAELPSDVSPNETLFFMRDSQGRSIMNYLFLVPKKNFTLQQRHRKELCVTFLAYGIPLTGGILSDAAVVNAWDSIETMLLILAQERFLRESVKSLADLVGVEHDITEVPFQRISPFARVNGSSPDRLVVTKDHTGAWLIKTVTRRTRRAGVRPGEMFVPTIKPYHREISPVLGAFARLGRIRMVRLLALCRVTYINPKARDHRGKTVLHHLVGGRKFLTEEADELDSIFTMPDVEGVDFIGQRGDVGQRRCLLPKEASKAWGELQEMCLAERYEGERRLMKETCHTIIVCCSLGAEATVLDKYNRSPLHTCAINNWSVEVASTLMSVNAPPEVKDVFGYTAADFAVKNGNVDSALVIVGGLSAQQADDDLMNAVLLANTRDTILLLRSYSLAPRSRQTTRQSSMWKNQTTPTFIRPTAGFVPKFVHRLAWEGRTAAIETLNDLGLLTPDVTMQDEFKMTPMDYAAANGKFATYSVLRRIDTDRRKEKGQGLSSIDAPNRFPAEAPMVSLSLLLELTQASTHAAMISIARVENIDGVTRDGHEFVERDIWADDFQEARQNIDTQSLLLRSQTTMKGGQSMRTLGTSYDFPEIVTGLNEFETRVDMVNLLRPHLASESRKARIVEANLPPWLSLIAANEHRLLTLALEGPLPCSELLRTCVDEFGNTVLHIAAKHNSLACLSILLRKLCRSPEDIPASDLEASALYRKYCPREFFAKHNHAGESALQIAVCAGFDLCSLELAATSVRLFGPKKTFVDVALRAIKRHGFNKKTFLKKGQPLAALGALGASTSQRSLAPLNSTTSVSPTRKKTKNPVLSLSSDVSGDNDAFLEMQRQALALEQGGAQLRNSRKLNSMGTSSISPDTMTRPDAGVLAPTAHKRSTRKGDDSTRSTLPVEQIDVSSVAAAGECRITAWTMLHIASMHGMFVFAAWTVTVLRDLAIRPLQISNTRPRTPVVESSTTLAVRERSASIASSTRNAQRIFEAVTENYPGFNGYNKTELAAFESAVELAAFDEYIYDDPLGWTLSRTGIPNRGDLKVRDIHARDATIWGASLAHAIAYGQSAIVSVIMETAANVCYKLSLVQAAPAPLVNGTQQQIQDMASISPNATGNLSLGLKRSNSQALAPLSGDLSSKLGRTKYTPATHEDPFNALNSAVRGISSAPSYVAAIGVYFEFIYTHLPNAAPQIDENGKIIPVAHASTRPMFQIPPAANQNLTATDKALMAVARKSPSSTSYDTSSFDESSDYTGDSSAYDNGSNAYDRYSDSESIPDRDSVGMPGDDAENPGGEKRTRMHQLDLLREVGAAIDLDDYSRAINGRRQELQSVFDSIRQVLPFHLHMSALFTGKIDELLPEFHPQVFIPANATQANLNATMGSDDGLAAAEQLAEQLATMDVMKAAQLGATLSGNQPSVLATQSPVSIDTTLLKELANDSNLHGPFAYPTPVQRDRQAQLTAMAQRSTAARLGRVATNPQAVLPPLTRTLNESKSPLGRAGSALLGTSQAHQQPPASSSYGSSSAYTSSYTTGQTGTDSRYTGTYNGQTESSGTYTDSQGSSSYVTGSSSYVTGSSSAYTGDSSSYLTSTQKTSTHGGYTSTHGGYTSTQLTSTHASVGPVVAHGTKAAGNATLAPQDVSPAALSYQTVNRKVAGGDAAEVFARLVLADALKAYGPAGIFVRQAMARPLGSECMLRNGNAPEPAGAEEAQVFFVAADSQAPKAIGPVVTAADASEALEMVDQSQRLRVLMARLLPTLRIAWNSLVNAYFLIDLADIQRRQAERAEFFLRLWVYKDLSLEEPLPVEAPSRELHWADLCTWYHYQRRIKKERAIRRVARRHDMHEFFRRFVDTFATGSPSIILDTASREQKRPPTQLQVAVAAKPRTPEAAPRTRKDKLKALDRANATGYAGQQTLTREATSFGASKRRLASMDASVHSASQF